MNNIEKKDIEILNTALGTEQFAIAVYNLASEMGILSERALKIAKTFQSHHGHHANTIREAIISSGFEPLKPLPQDEYAKRLPSNLVDEKSIIHYALTFEKNATVTYLNYIPELENKKIIHVAASILGDEAMHWAALRTALGLEPVHISFIPASVNEVED